MCDVRAEGLTYVNTDDAGIIVKVNYSGLIDQDSEVETITNKEKRKDGTEKITNTYCAVLNYNYDLEYIMYNRDGQKIDIRIVHSTQNIGINSKVESFKSKEYKTYNEAREYIRLNKEVIFNNIETDIITELLNSIRFTLEFSYGYPTDTHKVKVQYLSNKKHPEYEEYQELCNDIINGLSILTANGGVDEAIVALTPSEEYLKQIPSMFPDTKDKNHIMMRFISYYNLALIYANTDRWGLAKEMITKAIDNDYGTRDCKKLNECIEKQEENLKKNDKTSLHFPTLEEENIDEGHPSKWILAIVEEEERIAKLAAEAEAAARVAELNADEYLGEIEVKAISPTRLKVIVTMINEQVKERINTVKLIVAKGSLFDSDTPNYLHEYAIKNKSYANCKIKDFTISDDGTTLTTEISGLNIACKYYIMAYTNWNGIVKYTRDEGTYTREVNKEDWVDLGLSVKWASHNMGAKKITKLGNLYSWYSINPYGKKDTVNRSISFDQLPQSIAGDPLHDAATAAYGEGAQTPSIIQWNELFGNCEIYNVKLNRVRGYYFESRKTNNGIFIPFTDFISDCETRGDNNYGEYWTSEKTSDNPKKEGENMDYIRYIIINIQGESDSRIKGGNIKYYGKLHPRAVKK